MTLMRAATMTGALAMLLLLPACERSPEDSDPHVTIEGHRWDVELATTNNEQFTGMGGRSEAPTGTGMLFIFPDNAHRQFIMRACLIPLDIAFINSEGKIVAIHTMKVESDQRRLVRYPSYYPVNMALEVAGGEFDRLGIRVGHYVTFSKDTQRTIDNVTQRGH